MRDRLDDFAKEGAAILAIDPHERFAAQHFLKDLELGAQDVEIPLLLDPMLQASAAYGVAFQMRIHTEWSNRPATFVIDKNGMLRYEKRAQTFSDRPTPDQILEQIRRLP